MVFEAVKCPTCGGVEIQRYGQSSTGKKRYICRNSNCTRKTFISDYTYQGFGVWKKLKQKMDERHIKRCPNIGHEKSKH